VRQTHPASVAASEVAGLGLIVLDQLVYVDSYPACDTKSFGSNPMVQVGGPVPTALAQLRRLGIASRFVGSWANDTHGHVLEQHLTKDGIGFDRNACRTSPATGFAHAWIESATGRRTVVSVPPDHEPEPHDSASIVRSASILHLDGWGGDAAITAAKAVRNAGGRVTLDAGSVKPATERPLPFVTLLNVPKRFVMSFCGTNDVERGAQQLLASGPKLVTVTDGEHGAGVFTSEIAEWRPAFPVQSKDTCGAGDVFCGGLIASLLFGFEPVTALEFAMATAAIKVSRPGNRQLATLDEVQTFLNFRAG
jgi:sugar/nucleoside kinase (ribokinase family)